MPLIALACKRSRITIIIIIIIIIWSACGISSKWLCRHNSITKALFMKIRWYRSN